MICIRTALERLTQDTRRRYRAENCPDGHVHVERSDPLKKGQTNPVRKIAFAPDRYRFQIFSGSCLAPFDVWKLQKSGRVVQALGYHFLTIEARPKRIPSDLKLWLTF